MPGRRRLRSEGSEEREDQPRKRARREQPWTVPKALDDQTDLCASLLNSLRKSKGSDSKELGDFLTRLPSRRVCPGYYDVVSQPIDLMRIQHKVVTDEYPAISAFLADVRLLLTNSRLFYASDSDEYRQVDDLEYKFTQVLREHGFGVEHAPTSPPSSSSATSSRRTSESDSIKSPLTLRIPKMHFKFSSAGASVPLSPPSLAGDTTPSSTRHQSTGDSTPVKRKDDKVSSKLAANKVHVMTSEAWIQEYLESGDPVKIYLASIYSYHDHSSGEYVAEPFLQLPSKSLYPEYYKVITQPMDLDTIHNNVEAGKYLNLKAIQDDMIIMIKNAHHFNEPGSEIYKLASALRKAIINRCSELERKYQTVAKTFPPKVTPKRPPDSGSDGEGRKLPKLKIAVGAVAKKSQQRLSMGSVSEYDDQQIDSSDEDWSSEEEKDPDSAHSKLLLRIKKEKLGSATSPLSSPSSFAAQTPPLSGSMSEHVWKIVQAKKPPSLKKQLMAVYRAIVSKTDSEGRVLSELFMRRPSSKLYPEYYVVIMEPIDLKEILGRIRTGGFSGLGEMGQAVDLMVRNAVTFNEEDSQVYRDALELSGVTKAAIATIQQAWPATPSGSAATPPAVIHTGQRGRPRKFPLPPTPVNAPSGVVALFHAIKGHIDNSGRLVWLTFKSLPTGVSSDYYSVVKKPIDMGIIEKKMMSGLYQKVDHIFDDLSLMMDNAFKYFPRESQQSQDAIALQRTLTRKYMDLKAGDKGSGRRSIPVVHEHVQKLLSGIFSSLMGSKGAEELKGVVGTRKVELHTEGVVKHSFNLANMESWLAEGKYHRLDLLQLDLLAILEQACREGNKGVASEVGRAFLAARDRVCGDGREQLWSPALSYSVLQLELDLEAAVHSRLESPSPATPPPITSPSMSHSNSTSPKSLPIGNSSSSASLAVPVGAGQEWEGLGERCEESEDCEWEGAKYKIGDMVYVRPSDVSSQQKPHVVMIEKFWKDISGNMCFDGVWFYRPEETFHVATKKFYEKEVFRSDFHGVSRMAQIIRKCCVLFIRDYPRFYPEGFEEEDVFVCESRYAYKAKSFKKIKNWSYLGNPPLLTLRATPLSVIPRVPSIFASAATKKATPTKSKSTPSPEAEEVKEEEPKVIGPLDVSYVGLSLKNIVTTSSVPDSNIYYEQYCLDEDFFRLGDYVYLRSDQENPYIARIDKMWTDKNGDPWIHGPWFLHPAEVSHTPTRTFFQQELLLSNIQDSNPMRSISGKCLVLQLQDYCRKRPTGYEEKDVYVLQSRYNEADKEMKRVKGLKHPQLSTNSVADEIYYFAHDLQLTKVASPKLFTKEFNPQEIPIQPGASGSPGMPLPLVGLGKLPGAATAKGIPLALGGNKPGGLNVTPQLIQQLLASASKLATTRPVVIPLQSSAVTIPTTPLAQPSTSVTPSAQPSPSHTTPLITGSGKQQFPCQWEGCNEMYSGPVELYTHVCGPGPSHLSKEVEGAYYCRWKNCPRNPGVGGKPFDSMNKVMRHMREVHLMKLSTLFGIGARVPGRGGSATPPLTPFSTPQTPPTTSQVSMATASMPAPPPSASSSSTSQATPTRGPPAVPQIFLPPPENRQKLVHSDIYLRYIQGIKANSKQLSPSADSGTVRSTHTLPRPQSVKVGEWFSPEAIRTHWEGCEVKSGDPAVIDALWALRDHMMMESANLENYLRQFN